MDIFYLKQILERRAEQLLGLMSVLDDHGTRKLSPDEKRLIRQCVADDIMRDFEDELGVWVLRGGRGPDMEFSAWEELE